MRLGEGALPGHRGAYGDLEEFSEFCQLSAGFGVQNALPGKDEGSFGVKQCLRRLHHVVLVRTGYGCLDRHVTVDHGPIHLHFSDVRRYFQHGWPGLAQAHRREGSSKGCPHPLRRVDALYVFRHRVIAFQGAVHRRDAFTRGRMPERKEQHRHGV